MNKLTFQPTHVRLKVDFPWCAIDLLTNFCCSSWVVWTQDRSLHRRTRHLWT